MKKVILLYIVVALMSQPCLGFSTQEQDDRLDALCSSYNMGLCDDLAFEKAMANSLATAAEEEAYQQDLARAIEDSLDDLKSSILDVLVIGSGPSAHAFAANAVQDKIKVALAMGGNPGGAINVKTSVKNFGGPKEQYGYQIMYDWISKSEELGVPLLQETVIKVDLTDSVYRVTMSSGKIYETKSVVFAQGTKPRKISAENGDVYKVWEDDAWYQIGDFKRAAKDKTVLIVGAGIDSVNKIKNVMEGGATKVYIALRSGDIPAHIQEIEDVYGSKIEVLVNKSLKSITGSEGEVAGVIMTDQSTYAVDMIVNATGRVGNDCIEVVSPNPLLKDDQSGRLIVGADMMTNLPGVFAIGDIAALQDASGKVIQDDGRAIIAIGKGASGERGVARYLSSLK